MDLPTARYDLDNGRASASSCGVPVISPTAPLAASPAPASAAPPVAPTAFLQAVRARVDARLEEILGEAHTFTAATAPATLPVLQAARDLTFRGGKRLRPALLFAAVECVEPGAFPEAATDLGAALELLQTYLLVHDDWMDDDPIRRGAPSVHVALGKHYGDAHLGAATAILAGDLMGSLVHGVVAGIDLPTPRRRAVLSVFRRMEHEVILGQCLDVTRSPDIERIHHLKTGSYTVRGPLALGLGLAGASEAAREAVDAYALPLGLAFQLRDDVLGAFGSAAETGKPVGGDFREGKETFLLHHARAHLGTTDRQRLDARIGRRDLTDADIAEVQSLLTASGAREAADARVVALRGQCLAALDTPALQPQGRALLQAFAAWLTDRTR